MKVSAIVPCYNAGRWIAGALRSAAEQTEPPQEIILIDDGSSDDSLAQARKVDVNVRIVRTPHLGPAGARLAGIRHAIGDWIAYLDADDLWCPEHLQRARETIGESDVAYMTHLDCMVDGEERVQKVEEPLTNRLTTGLPDSQFLSWLADRWYFSPSSVLQNRAVVLQVGGPDPDPKLKGREDVELFLRVVHGRTWTYNPIPAWIYRTGNSESVSANRIRGEQNMLNALVKNEALYRGSVMSRAIRLVARRTMAMAFTEGNLEERRVAWESAWHRLPCLFRLYFLGLRAWPVPFQQLIRAKRKLQRFK